MTIKRKENHVKIKACESTTKTRAIKKRLWSLCGQLKRAVTDPEREILSVQEEAIIDELREEACVSNWGHYNLVHSRLKDFEEVLKLMSPTSK